MTIIEVRPPRSRNLIGWYGRLPPADILAVFVNRGFAVRACIESDLQAPAQLSTLAAVIFVQNPEKANRIVTPLASYGKSILDHGCQIFVMAVTGHETLDGGLVSFAAPLRRVSR